MQINFWAKLKMVIKPLKIDRLSWFFFQNYMKFFTRSILIGQNIEKWNIDEVKSQVEIWEQIFSLNRATFTYLRSQKFYDTNQIKIPKIYPPV